jgi:hypothetical protein
MPDGCIICEHGRHGLRCPYCEDADAVINLRARLSAALTDAMQARTKALEEAARLVADWPGIPSQQDVADAILELEAAK